VTVTAYFSLVKKHTVECSQGLVAAVGILHSVPTARAREAGDGNPVRQVGGVLNGVVHARAPVLKTNWKSPFANRVGPVRTNGITITVKTVGRRQLRVVLVIWIAVGHHAS